MSQSVSKMLRLQVASRANSCCEYCRLPDSDSFYGFQVDHVVSRKHGGNDEFENLAWACADCNRLKGTDLGTFLRGSDQLTRFFNPRKDRWALHFQADSSGVIDAKTDIGGATIKIFELNHPDRIIERQLLNRLGLWPQKG